MVMPTKETGSTIKPMERMENISILMEPNTLENGMKMLNKEKERKHGQMVLAIEELI